MLFAPRNTTPFDAMVTICGGGEILQNEHSTALFEYDATCPARSVASTSMTPAQFAEKMQGFTRRLDGLFKESTGLEQEIKKQLAGLRYE